MAVNVKALDISISHAWEARRRLKISAAALNQSKKRKSFFLFLQLPTPGLYLSEKQYMLKTLATAPNKFKRKEKVFSFLLNLKRSYIACVTSVA
jgi:hypothetical protein